MPKVLRKPYIPPVTAANANEPPLPAAFSTVTAARFLGVSVKTIYRLIAAGRIKAKSYSRRTLVNGDSLRAFYAALPDKVTS